MSFHRLWAWFQCSPYLSAMIARRPDLLSVTTPLRKRIRGDWWFDGNHSVLSTWSCPRPWSHRQQRCEAEVVSRCSWPSGRPQPWPWSQIITENEKKNDKMLLAKTIYLLPWKSLRLDTRCHCTATSQSLPSGRPTLMVSSSYWSLTIFFCLSISIPIPCTSVVPSYL